MPLHHCLLVKVAKGFVSGREKERERYRDWEISEGIKTLFPSMAYVAFIFTVETLLNHRYKTNPNLHLCLSSHNIQIKPSNPISPTRTDAVDIYTKQVKLIGTYCVSESAPFIPSGIYDDTFTINRQLLVVNIEVFIWITRYWPHWSAYFIWNWGMDK